MKKGEFELFSEVITPFIFFYCLKLTSMQKLNFTPTEDRVLLTFSAPFVLRSSSPRRNTKNIII